jgi:hypothetical protein
MKTILLNKKEKESANFSDLPLPTGKLETKIIQQKSARFLTIS